MRRGLGLGPAGCPRRMPFGRGLIGTAASIVAGLALNDLANPDGFLRGSWRRIVQARSSVRVIGCETTGKLGDGSGSEETGARKDRESIKDE